MICFFHNILLVLFLEIVLLSIYYYFECFNKLTSDILQVCIVGDKFETLLIFFIYHPTFNQENAQFTGMEVWQVQGKFY